MKIDETGKPMMSEADIKAVLCVLEKIERQAAIVALEWGSGNSTIQFSKGAHVASWVSVEHNGHYIQYLADKVNSMKVTLVYVPENEYYVDCVKQNAGHYNFILIDGISEQRGKCLEAAYDMLAPGGVVLLHDWNRKEYADFIKNTKFPHREVLTEGEIPDGKFTVHRGIMLFQK